jgi:hypothetical protein
LPPGNDKTTASGFNEVSFDMEKISDGSPANGIQQKERCDTGSISPQNASKEE